MAYRLACNREPPPPPEPDFTGGQCPTNYTVNTTFQRKNVIAFQCQVTPVEGASTPFVMGPILGLVTERSSNADVLYIVHGANGAMRTEVTSNTDSPGCPGQFSNYRITSAVRTDGLPDNCGDPPPPTPTPEPGYNSPLIVVNYTDNSSNDISLNTRFTFLQPIVKIDGSIRVPLRIDVGDIGVNIRGDIDVNTGDININFGNQNYNPSNEPNPDAYDSPDDIPDVPPDVPTPVVPPSPDNPNDDTTTILRACIVTVSSVGDEQSIIYQNANPDIFVPNLGYVQFLIAVNNRLAWTSDIPVKNTRHFIPCPWQGGALAVRGTPRVGVAWTISPVYDKAESSIPAT